VSAIPGPLHQRAGPELASPMRRSLQKCPGRYIDNNQVRISSAGARRQVNKPWAGWPTAAARLLKRSARPQRPGARNSRCFMRHFSWILARKGVRSGDRAASGPGRGSRWPGHGDSGIVRARPWSLGLGSQASAHRLSTVAFIKNSNKTECYKKKRNFLTADTPDLLDKYSNQHWFITIFRGNLSTGINLNA
jgi:hypothetical protein